jgi:hypothetical protein
MARCLHAVATHPRNNKAVLQQLRRKGLFCSLLLFLAVPGLLEARPPKQSDCSLPRIVISYCEKQLPQAVVIEETHLSIEMLDYLRANMGKAFCANVAIADLDGNGFPDYAFLLADVSRSPTRLALYAALMNNHGVQKLYCLDTWDSDFSGKPPNHALELYLTVMPKGKSASPTGGHGALQGQAVALTNPAILLHFFERSETAFYWDGKDFCKVCLGD